MYAVVLKDRTKGFVLVEKIPKEEIYDQSSERLVLLVSENPHNSSHIAHIPMLSKDEKEIQQIWDPVTLKKQTMNMREDIFGFEKKM